MKKKQSISEFVNSEIEVSKVSKIYGGIDETTMTSDGGCDTLCDHDGNGPDPGDTIENGC